MTLEQKQAKLDVAKWIKSEETGRDCCGEFDYCAVCNKEDEYPCASAFDRFNESKAKPVQKKPAAKKSATAKPATAKPVAKKPAAKK